MKRNRLAISLKTKDQFRIWRKWVAPRPRGIPLLLGGVHATLNPDEALASCFDAICVGEGEFSTLELVTRIERGEDITDIPGLWIRRGSAVERNPPRSFLEDLDSLPFPDRDMWQPWIRAADDVRYTSILLGRGCPFLCTYCCNHAIRMRGSGKYVRVRSARNIIEEIEAITSASPGIEEFGLEVESIAIRKEWTLALCAELQRLNVRRRVPLAFRTNVDAPLGN